MRVVPRRLGGASQKSGNRTDLRLLSGVGAPVPGGRSEQSPVAGALVAPRLSSSTGQLSNTGRSGTADPNMADPGSAVLLPAVRCAVISRVGHFLGNQGVQERKVCPGRWWEHNPLLRRCGLCVRHSAWRGNCLPADPLPIGIDRDSCYKRRLQTRWGYNLISQAVCPPGGVFNLELSMITLKGGSCGIITRDSPRSALT